MRNTKRTIEALIMNAALDVFSSGDFEKATMRSIAERANIPTSTIYKYFKNKDDLYVTLISTIVDKTTRELAMHLTGLSSAKSKLHEMARFHLNFFQENRNIAHLVCASTNVSYWYAYEKAHAKVKESGSALGKIIREGQRTGEIRPGLNLRVLNHLYFGALRSMVTNWLYRYNVYILSELATPFAEYFYSAICSQTYPQEKFICPLMKKSTAYKRTYGKR